MKYPAAIEEMAQNAEVKQEAAETDKVKQAQETLSEQQVALSAEVEQASDNN